MIPAVLMLSGRKVLQESQLLSMQHVNSLESGDKACLKRCAEGWRGLQWHSKMRQWMFYAFIACPGASQL